MYDAVIEYWRTTYQCATRRSPGCFCVAWSAAWLPRTFGMTTLAAALSIADVCLASAHGASPEPAEASAPTPPDANSNGIYLGEFDIRSHYPIKAQKSNVEFVLYASASEDDRERARHVTSERQHKIRDQVIVTTRLVPLAEFDEPDLKRFRRRILLRLRRTLPELVIDDVYVSEFQIKVQSM